MGKHVCLERLGFVATRMGDNRNGYGEDTTRRRLAVGNVITELAICVGGLSLRSKTVVVRNFLAERGRLDIEMVNFGRKDWIAISDVQNYDGLISGLSERTIPPILKVYFYLKI